MPGPLSYQADVRRRIIEALITIAPDAPFPIKLIKNVISADSMIGGPAEIVLDNLAIAGPAALREHRTPGENGAQHVDYGHVESPRS